MVRILSEKNNSLLRNKEDQQYISILQSISNVKKIEIPDIYTEIASFYNKILFNENDVILVCFGNKTHFIIEKIPNSIYIYFNDTNIEINNLQHQFLLDLRFKRDKRLSLFFENTTLHGSMYKKYFFLGNEIIINLTNKEIIKKVYKAQGNKIIINNVRASETIFYIKTYEIKSILSNQVNYIPAYLKFLKYIKEKNPIIENYKNDIIKYNDLSFFIKKEFVENYKNDIDEHKKYIIDLIKNL
ncbi:MAG: hypothetical protein QW350_04915 [Candidatus Aenigmatarchaeota archaeon]